MTTKREYELSASELNHRLSVTKVRGGWTKDKVKKELKTRKPNKSKSNFQKEMSKFDSPEELEENMLYHGSARNISMLKPSIILKDTGHFGGGYGQKYYGVSLSRDRNIASNFTGVASGGYEAPVLLKKGAVIKHMPNLKDASEIEDIIADLWEEGIDAVILGDKNDKNSEQEVVVLNTNIMSIGESTYFRVFQKKKMPSFSKEEIEEMWLNSGKRYKEEALVSWDNHNELMKSKYGKPKDVNYRWSSSKEFYLLRHKESVELYNAAKNDELASKINEENVPQKKVVRKRNRPS